MIHKIESVNTRGIIYTFSILSFVLMMMFAFANQSTTFTSGWNELFNLQTEALAQPLHRSPPSPLDGMNFSKPQDVYSKDGVLKTPLSQTKDRES